MITTDGLNPLKFIIIIGKQCSRVVAPVRRLWLPCICDVSFQSPLSPPWWESRKITCSHEILLHFQSKPFVPDRAATIIWHVAMKYLLTPKSLSLRLLILYSYCVMCTTITNYVLRPNSIGLKKIRSTSVFTVCSQMKLDLLYCSIPHYYKTTRVSQIIGILPVRYSTTKSHFWDHRHSIFKTSPRHIKYTYNARPMDNTPESETLCSSKAKYWNGIMSLLDSKTLTTEPLVRYIAHSSPSCIQQLMYQ